MNTYVDKAKDSASQSVADTVSTGSREGGPTFQFVDNRPAAIAQRNVQSIANSYARTHHKPHLQGEANRASVRQPLIQKKNNTGLPDHLKTGIEQLSGYSMDDVKVHYNSAKPAQLQAHAYAQGNTIHLGPGQEKHLPHEAWHVIQQKQGRVKPTRQLKGKVQVNDDQGLEAEADRMGRKAMQLKGANTPTQPSQNASAKASRPLQLKTKVGGPPQQVVQRNAILKNEYRRLESPPFTVAKHLAWVTGQPVGQVLADIALDVPLAPQLARPDRVIAYIAHATGSAPRPALITQIGRLGNFEEQLRGRNHVAYNGGHLLALELYNNWAFINSPRNLAPQRATDNLAPGEWRRAEIKTNNGDPVLYEAAVTYPDRTYTVTAAQMGSVLTPGSATALALANAGLSKWIPWTVNTWTPSQFHLSVTAVKPSDAPTREQNLTGNDPTNWMPVLHRVVSPLKGLLTRIVPGFQLAEHQQRSGYIGGVDLRRQGPHPIGDSLNELKQIVIDVAKITTMLRFTGASASILSTLIYYLPGMEAVLSLAPSTLAGAPIAALLIYAAVHQLNITRLLPEGPGFDWLKYLLNMLGL